jgi:hypothetical protein
MMYRRSVLWLLAFAAVFLLATTPATALAAARGVKPLSPRPAASQAGSCSASAWHVVPSASPGAFDNVLAAVPALSPSDAWAVGWQYVGPSNSQVTLTEHWNGLQWTAVNSPNVGPAWSSLQAVSGVASNDVWAVGYYYDLDTNSNRTLIEHWNGTAWNVFASPNQGTSVNVLTGVAAISANDVWAVGNAYSDQPAPALIEHWNGTSWNLVTSPSPGQANSEYKLYSVLALATDNVWAVGYGYFSGQQTLTEHWDGANWTVVTSSNVQGAHTDQLTSVSGTAANDIWAVGYSSDITGISASLVEHWNGVAWAIVPSPNPGTPSSDSVKLLEVAALSAGAAWAVGSDFAADSTYEVPVIERWNGNTWSLIASPTLPSNYAQLNGVLALSMNNAIAVGQWSGTSGSQTLVEQYTTPKLGILCG